MRTTLRFALILVLLLGAELFLYARAGREELPSRQPLASFPMQLGEWDGTDVRLEPEVLKILGDGEFLYRFYRAPEKPYVDFFVAYFPTQRTGSTIHSPQNCLPGAGWTPLEKGLVQIAPAGREPIAVNRYVIGKGAERQLVLYWYQSNGRVVAGEYWAKIFLVWDSMRRHRSDGALVRIVTPVLPNEPLENAQRRATLFAESAVSSLDAVIPR
jgi:EpsI family protein